jgi:hypothetical protein
MGIRRSDHHCQRRPPSISHAGALHQLPLIGKTATSGD